MNTPETGDITEQPPSVERAAWAIAELCSGNEDNKAAVLELHGIAPLVWLLDGPADSMATTGMPHTYFYCHHHRFSLYAQMEASACCRPVAVT